ncbi:MAG: hypothetical protein A2Z14_16840 [Chloroflexi bacterium RBG_16_48_8]|nr:MAG: hypothetical protein A2Z14_16840 [Chloroflexi bacterium RBG_16_48_8]
MQELIVAFLVGIISGLVVDLILRSPRFLHRRHLRLLLNLPKDQDLIFIYPPRQRDYAILPRAATEDFMGINNLISALLSIGWSSDRFVIRDTERITQQQCEDANVITLCSPKSNSFTAMVQRELLDDGVHHYYFDQVVIKNTESESLDSEPQWAITDGNGYYPSPITQALKDYEKEQQKQEGTMLPPLHERSLVDYAAVTKVRNPWRPEKHVLIVAGVRAIGTWGAAETIKKWYDLIYKEKKGRFQRSRKDGYFSALLKIEYRNSDIIKAEIIGLIDINM